MKKSCRNGAAVLFLFAFLSKHVEAFMTPTTGSRYAFTHRHNMVATPEESAKALSDYMAKSHEDKLRAVKEIETKKNAEIEALQKEIDSLKSPSSALATTTAPPPNVAEGSKEELAAKVIAYQQFMAKYIVQAQEQKVKAIRDAENAVTKKYEEKLLLVGGAAPPAAAAPPAMMSKEQKLYMERNAKVSQAAAAGKSRWGHQEVERVSKESLPKTSVNVGASLLSSSAAANGAVVHANGAAAPPSVPVPPEVQAANHGLRSDGSVGGLTLAERVALGATADASSTPVVAVSKNNLLYQRRNALVAAAGKASRWGDMEVQNAMQLVSQAPLASASSAEVQAADHGLRADGSVGGPSLAERVNLGAQLLGR